MQFSYKSQVSHPFLPLYQSQWRLAHFQRVNDPPTLFTFGSFSCSISRHFYLVSDFIFIQWKIFSIVLMYAWRYRWLANAKSFHFSAEKSNYEIQAVTHGFLYLGILIVLISFLEAWNKSGRIRRRKEVMSIGKNF